MRTPPARLLSLCGLLVCLALAPAQDARAEDGPEMDEASKKVKEQMEKVLELMRQNEEALTLISTGGRDKPRPVDVEVPDVPPAEGAPGSDGSSSSGSAAGSTSGGGGREAARALEEIIRGQRGAGGKIPGELEELVRLVPQ